MVSCLEIINKSFKRRVKLHGEINELIIRNECPNNNWRVISIE